MSTADEYADLTGPGGAWTLFRWEAYDPANRVDLCASALAVDDRLFFVDPIPLAREALAELTAGRTPAGIIVTNGNHARAADAFRRRWKVPLASTAEAAADAGLEVDQLIPAEGGPVLCDAFRAISLAGGAVGEVALHRADGEGVLIVGDAIINLPSYPLGRLPDKYCANPRELRRSVSRLLDLPFSKMLFAHGEPVLSRAHERLSAALNVGERP